MASFDISLFMACSLGASGDKVFFCWIYNARGWGLRSKPPLELLCQVGYLLVLPLSCMLNEQPIPDWRVWIYLILFCMQSQLIGEVMDIVPDRKGGRRRQVPSLEKEIPIIDYFDCDGRIHFGLALVLWSCISHLVFGVCRLVVPGQVRAL